MDFDREHLEVAAKAVGLVAALLAFYSGWIQRPLIAVWKWMVAVAKMPARVSDIVNEMNTGDESIHASVRRIERDLCVLTQRQRILADDAEDAIVETDHNGLVVWVNRTYSRLMGKTLDEVHGHGWTAVVPADDRERLAQDWLTVVADRREYQRFDQRFIGPDGSEFTARVRTRAVKASGSEIIGWVSLIRKIATP